MTRLAVHRKYQPILNTLPQQHVDHIITNKPLHSHIMNIIHQGMRHRYSDMRIKEILNNELELFTAPVDFVEVNGNLIDIENYEPKANDTAVFYDKFMQEKHFSFDGPSHGLGFITFGLI